jgi:hypothetical protein
LIDKAVEIRDEWDEQLSTRIANKLGQVLGG